MCAGFGGLMRKMSRSWSIVVNLKSGYSFEASMPSSPSSKFIKSPFASMLCIMDIGMSSGGGKAATIENGKVVVQQLKMERLWWTLILI